jgi:phage shock protein A
MTGKDKSGRTKKQELEEAERLLKGWPQTIEHARSMANHLKQFDPVMYEKGMAELRAKGDVEKVKEMEAMDFMGEKARLEKNVKNLEEEYEGLKEYVAQLRVEVSELQQ